MLFCFSRTRTLVSPRASPHILDANGIGGSPTRQTVHASHEGNFARLDRYPGNTVRRRAKLLACSEVNYRIGLRRGSIPAGFCINDSSGKRGDPSFKGSRIIVEDSAVQHERFRVLAANSE